MNCLFTASLSPQQTIFWKDIKKMLIFVVSKIIGFESLRWFKYELVKIFGEREPTDCLKRTFSKGIG